MLSSIILNQQLPNSTLVFQTSFIEYNLEKGRSFGQHTGEDSEHQNNEKSQNNEHRKVKKPIFTKLQERKRDLYENTSFQKENISRERKYLFL